MRLNSDQNAKAPAALRRMNDIAQARQPSPNKALEKGKIVVDTVCLTPLNYVCPAFKQRNQGNSCFKSSRFEPAIKHYKNALSVLSEEAVGNNELSSKLYSNMSVCYAKLGDFQQAEEV